MLEIMTIVAVALAVLVIALLAYAATKPDTFTIERSMPISASPELIFPLISNPRRMNTWNPFVAPDPAIKLVYTGPESGKGAAHTWAGNSKVGEGRIEVTDVSPPNRVAMQLDMLKPMKASNKVVFTLQPTAGATTVTWAMTGRQPLIGKLMTIFIDCEKMVGGQFEKGLTSLKSIAERATTST